jgi:hypothetical protein
MATRESYDLPTVISTTGVTSDAVLYEAPKDPSQHFYLPSYKIAMTPEATGRGKWVTFEPAGTSFVLTVHLADATLPSLSQGNTPLHPDAHYKIVASVPDRPVDLALTSVASPSGAALTLTATLADFAERDALYAAMTDPSAGAQLTIVRTPDIAAQVNGDGGPTFLAGSYTIESRIPFIFSKDLDADIFAGLTGHSVAPPAWTSSAVDWNGRRYFYYQTSNRPGQVYYLPDAYKVGREAHPPHRPTLAVTADAVNADTARMTLSYIAGPVWEADRITAAAKELQGALGLTAPPAMALLQSPHAQMLLNLPAADATAGVLLVEQKGAVIDLVTGIRGSVTMGLTQFKQVYDAMFDRLSAILSGEVRVPIANDIATIPFVARIDDIPAEVLKIETAVDTANNALRVTLRNTIESPVHVEAISGTILRAGQPIESSVIGTEPSLPADIGPAAAAPGQADGTMVVVMGPSAANTVAEAIGGLLGGLLGGGRNLGGQAASDVAATLMDTTCVPNLDFGKVTMAPDRTAFFKAIMRNQSIGSVAREVELKFLAGQLTVPEPPPAPKPAPADIVAAVRVVFENGKTANFDATLKADEAGFLNQTVTMNVGMEAFVLGTEGSNTYKYRVDVVTGAGIKQGDWTTDNADTLYVVVPS